MYMHIYFCIHTDMRAREQMEMVKQMRWDTNKPWLRL